MVNYDELKTAVALLVDTYKPWDLWTTFTFKYECRDYTAEKCFRRFMSQYLLRRAKYFYAIESNRFRDGTHLHACIGNVRNVYRKEIWSEWFHRYGRCHIVPYDERKNCGEYMAKYMLKESAFNWNIHIPHIGNPNQMQFSGARVTDKKGKITGFMYLPEGKKS